ncbi:MAG: hypothetical protein KAS73_10020 [Candidatus Sabulitectum sp.]|nr:hypothetical protein [Candidatus Sabulitectum sp.]
MKILWYVSSHGWGHGARQRELIRVYRLKYPDTHITVASDVPMWFWKGSRINSIVAGSPSPIVVEKDGDIDLKATRTHFHHFADHSSSYLKTEVARQLLLKPDLVISDIDPLPVKAAGVNSIPALGIGNFTWDWIIKEMFPDMGAEAALVADMYHHGTYLKLPMSPDHSPFGSTVNVPLLRGGPPGNPDKVRDLLPAGNICLVALREIPRGVELSVPDNFTAVSCLPEPVHRICQNITPSELADAGAAFADLVAACDVLLTKPGYGIISQILTMGKKAVLLTGRKFPEEKYLLDTIKQTSASILIGKESLLSTKAFIRSAKRLHPLPKINCNGGTIATNLINSSRDGSPHPMITEPFRTDFN